MISSKNFIAIKMLRSLCAAALSASFDHPKFLLDIDQHSPENSPGVSRDVSVEQPAEKNAVSQQLMPLFIDLVSQLQEALSDLNVEADVPSADVDDQLQACAQDAAADAAAAANPYAPALVLCAELLKNMRSEVLGSLTDTQLIQSFQEMLCLGYTKDHVAPIESLYKVWTEDPTCKLMIAGERNHLMGDAALHMKELLATYELDIPDRLMPDHLSVELSLYQLLITHADLVVQREFLQDHLDWISDLTTAASDYTARHQQAAAGLYLRLLKLCEAFLEGERRYLAL